MLRLVRPRSYVLALGLGLVASKVCIPLDQRCLHAPCLYSTGLVVLRDHTNCVCGVAAIVYGGNKARGVSAESLIVKTVGSIRERLAEKHVGDPLARGEGPRLSTELPDRELGPCEGFLARGSNED